MADTTPAVNVPRTKTEVALQIVREKILAGELQPGEKVRAEALAAELDMSATPIREALRLLQADRLVHYKPHHGIVVAGISPKEVQEIYVARAILEPPVAVMATPVVRERLMDRLESIHSQFVASRRHTEARDIGALNARWHWEIYRAAGSSYLQQFIEQLWDRLPWRTMWARPEDLDRSISQHEEIMGAIRAGATDEVGELMRVHVLSGSDNLIRRAREPQPETER